MSEDEPRPSANAEVARLFAEIGDILELKGEQPYRYNAYRTAARSVGNARERLDELFQQGRLRELYGIGSALEAKIVEYLTTGEMEYYERQRRDFPAALASLLQVPGLGPTRADGQHVIGGGDLQAEMRERAGVAEIRHFVEGEIERWILHVELRVAGANVVSVKVSLRFNPTGACTAASPIIATVLVGNDLATAESADFSYVPIPEGSSSEAPVTRPGPRTRTNRFTGCDSRIKSALYFRLSTGACRYVPLIGAQYNHTVWHFIKYFGRQLRRSEGSIRTRMAGRSRLLCK